MIILDGLRIIRMTVEGIGYLDEDAFEHFIYFQDCYEHEVERHLKSDYWEKYKALNHLKDDDWEKYVERVKSYKQVATRNIIDLYIEFYTEPRTRFKFETREAWFKLREHIEESGWYTWDMT